MAGISARPKSPHRVVTMSKPIKAPVFSNGVLLGI